MLYMFCICFVHGKFGLKWSQMWLGDVGSTNQDLANILGGTDLHSDNFHLFVLLGIPDFWISRFLDSQIQDRQLWP